MMIMPSLMNGEIEALDRKLFKAIRLFASIVSINAPARMILTVRVRQPSACHME